jgi:hypothetical protein
MMLSLAGFHCRLLAIVGAVGSRHPRSRARHGDVHAALGVPKEDLRVNKPSKIRP